ncbi:MAG: Rieske 2Fe-2S domain-containing protein [Gammaproteobacteria bacterium]|nr:Rieske 2Fe-2S domain-containing protein [Gammaproteobacteria bacterium]
MKQPAIDDFGDLVRKDRVHRRVYTDPAVFELEQQRIFNRSWLFAGHESQVPRRGDFITTQLAGQTLIVIRHEDDIKVLFNRCPHRGAKICETESGNARPFRCPYHGWVFDTDGRLISSSLHGDYGDFTVADADLNVRAVPRMTNYRGFVFVNLCDDGPGLEQALGPMMSAIDNLLDRSPEGAVELIPGIHRHVFPGNWKLLLENISDAAHPPFVHASSNEAGTKGRLEDYRMRAEDVMSGNNQAAGMLGQSKLKAFQHGHSYLAAIPIRIKVSREAEQEYRTAMVQSHGVDKAETILNDSRHFNIIYPQIMLQSVFQTVKVLRPVAIDRTEVSVYVFRLKGAPQEYERVAVQFANATNSSASVILQDDLTTFANIQEGLAACAGDWVLFANGYGNDIADGHGAVTGEGFSELPMRSQFAAWRDYMAAGPSGN